MQNEIQLLNRAKRLEPDALAEIHETYYVGIYRYISFRVGDAQMVEDLTSEVFTRLLGALQERNAPQNTIRGWLYGAASNVVKEHYRKQKRDQAVELNETIPSNMSSPEESLESMMTNEALQVAIKTLTDEQQQILALRFGFGMPIREVAKTVNKTVGSVKMLQVRAIASLTKLLPGQEVHQ
ncbi:MAG: sigma-70 family RNA polymerase sigma factor [Chloroflexi bacterium]|nr:sigma-70 family RNA polymerase sigma factor [Chloroflexota bacterium]